MKKERKKYSKPVLKKNEPLVNITFATGVVSPTPGTGPVAITGGSPASGAAT